MIEHYYGAMGARETIKMENTTTTEAATTKKEIVKTQCYICENLFTKERFWHYTVEQKPINICKMCCDDLIEQMIENEQVSSFEESED